MASAKNEQVGWQSQSPDQTGHSQLISAGDITFVLASLFLGVMQLLPASRRIQIIDKASTFLAGLLHIANVHSTQTIRRNLKAVLGQDRPPDVIERDVRQLLAITVWNSSVMHTMPVLGREQIADLVPVDNLSRLDECLTENRPVLVWGYHFGVHPLIVAAILYAQGYPIHAITHVRQMPAGATAFQRHYLKRLEGIGAQFPVINPREGLQRKMLDVLQSKECLYITPDYMVPLDEIDPDSAFVAPVDLLQRQAWLQTGGLRLAKRLKAKVVTVLSTQDEKRQLRLAVEPFEFATSGLTPAELQRDLQMSIKRLESHVIAHPNLWWDLKRDDFLQRLAVISLDK
jgi:lauroyl/myristoyl acyltransferase